jgi:hypothetical protein
MKLTGASMKERMLMAVLSVAALTLGACGGKTDSSTKEAASDQIYAAEVKGQQTSESPVNDIKQDKSENFLIGTCVIPEVAKYDRCTTEDLLSEGEVSAYFIFRESTISIHIALPNVNENGQDGTFREKIQINPATYEINGNEISVTSTSNNNNGPCAAEQVYKKVGDELFMRVGEMVGSCDAQIAVRERQDLVSGLDSGQYQKVRFTTNN